MNLTRKNKRIRKKHAIQDTAQYMMRNDRATIQKIKHPDHGQNLNIQGKAHTHTQKNTLKGKSGEKNETLQKCPDILRQNCVSMLLGDLKTQPQGMDTDGQHVKVVSEIEATEDKMSRPRSINSASNTSQPPDGVQFYPAIRSLYREGAAYFVWRVHFARCSMNRVCLER